MNEGLSEKEAQEKLFKEGYNDIHLEEKKYFWQLIFDLLKQPMIFLLIAASVIYLLLGDKAEAILLSSSIVIIIAITLYQERRAQKSLQALQKLASPKATVIRDGAIKRISGREVVVDDIIIIEEGDRVPADAKVISAFDLEIDESLLTGESITVEKNIGTSIYAGTLIVEGHAKAKVFATGLETKMGQIGKFLGKLTEEETSLQKQVGQIIKIIAILGLFLCFLLIVLYTLSRGNLLEGILAGIALAMGILPEEFAVVLTIFIALGAWQLAKKKVLARRAITLETLGKATILCVDKTGTLTQNKMSISEIATADKIYTQENLKEVLEIIGYGILASKEQTIDPIEVALKQTYLTLTGKEYRPEGNLIKEYPIVSKSISFIRIWQNEIILAAAKGAPEDIADLCHLNADGLEKLEQQIEAMAKKGLKILAVAKEKLPLSNIPDNRHEIEFELLGLVGFADPLRPESRQAISICYEAGIRVILMTGDYPVTAINIAQQIGLKNAQDIVTGEDLDKLSPKELQETAKHINIFSRVGPQQKLIIINALKSNNEVVAMTGDGVNDAPALKAADIGVAMGYRGTEVAREASDLVLLDDNFSSIVEGIGFGRNIYNNLKKAIGYIVTFHIPIAGLALLPVIFNLPLILLPAHIVFLELIVDPTCTLVFQAENNEQALMRKKPLKINDSLLDGFSILRNLITGLVILAITFLIYVLVLNYGISDEKARAITFVSLIMANLALILTTNAWPKSLLNRRLFKNRTIYLVFAYTALLLLAVFFFPAIRNLFAFEKLTFFEILIAAISIVVSFLAYEFLKLLNSRAK